MSEKNSSGSLPDQADVLAQLTQAKADLATAKQTIGTLGGQIETLKSQLTEANGKVTSLQGESTKLTTERDTLKADNSRLSGEMADFNKRLATELAKHGIRSTAAQKTAVSTDGKKPTATELVLARRGVQTVEQLSTLKKN